jgi:hypothetical protein
MLPWGTLDAKQHSPVVIDRARIAWSSIAMSEYRAAAAFADVLGAMLAARTPLDIVGMGGDFIADELMHVELASRLAMELGGGAPLVADFESMGVRPTAGGNALERCNELVVRVGCIAETLSGAIAVETRAVVDQPLVHAIVERIARDEARHMRFGWLYLEWAAGDMTDAERSRLARIALEELGRVSVLWRARPHGAGAPDLGWLEPARARSRLLSTIKDDIVTPLGALGITLAQDEVQALA